MVFSFRCPFLACLITATYARDEILSRLENICCEKVDILRLTNYVFFYYFHNEENDGIFRVLLG